MVKVPIPDLVFHISHSRIDFFQDPLFIRKLAVNQWYNYNTQIKSITRKQKTNNSMQNRYKCYV